MDRCAMGEAARGALEKLTARAEREGAPKRWAQQDFNP